MRSTKKNPRGAPTTFKELKSSPTWRTTLRLLARADETIMVAEGPACMGSYVALVLTGKGFQLEQGKSGMTAAFSGNDHPERTPIRSAKKIAEKAIRLSEPLPDDLPGTSTPTESEIVADVLLKIEKIRGKKKPAKA